MNSKRGNNLKILDKTYQLNRFLLDRIPTFDNKYKFTLGVKIFNLIEDSMELILLANKETDKRKASEHLNKFMVDMTMVDINLRFANELCLISDKHKAMCDVWLSDILSQSKGWQNWFGKTQCQNGAEHDDAPASNS